MNLARLLSAFALLLPPLAPPPRAHRRKCRAAPPALETTARPARAGGTSAGAEKHLRFARGRDSIAARAPAARPQRRDVAPSAPAGQTRQTDGPRRRGPSCATGSATILESEAQRHHHGALGNGCVHPRDDPSSTQAPWFRVRAISIRRKRAAAGAGARRVSRMGRPDPLRRGSRVRRARPPALVEHRATYTSGRALADWFASHGYAVIVIDAFHFGRRAPRDLNGLPKAYDPRSSMPTTLKRYDSSPREPRPALLTACASQLAGTTWDPA